MTGYDIAASIRLALCAALTLSACSGGNPGSTENTNMAKLAWDPVLDVPITSYRLYFGTSPGAYSQKYGSGIAVGNVTVFSLYDLTPRTKYFFAVTAVDSVGHESYYSNEVSIALP